MLLYMDMGWKFEKAAHIRKMVSELVFHDLEAGRHAGHKCIMPV